MSECHRSVISLKSFFAVLQSRLHKEFWLLYILSRICTLWVTLCIIWLYFSILLVRGDCCISVNHHVICFAC